jgi:hypothetical protein
MNNDDKQLLELAKKILKVDSYKQIAIAIGMKESSVVNWSNRGLSEIAKIKINQMINKTQGQLVSIPDKLNSNISEKEIEILEAYRKLDQKKQQLYYHKILADAAQAEIDADEVDTVILKGVKSAV